jgi:pimeloyl-ACP methyl ester carboxylesterase
MSAAPAPPSARELDEVERANASGKPAVVFVHGLWLLAGSWDPWRGLFESNGYSTVAVDWPDDPATVAEGRDQPEAFAGKGIAAITDHIAGVIARLAAKPAIIGHSFGGLITQKLAGAGLATASVPVDPGPFRGVLPLPVSALKAAFPVLGKPTNRKRAVMLTDKQFRFAFTNAVDEAEAARLYETFPVPGPGLPLFQAAFANVNPRSEASVETKNLERGPMKFISGGKDNTVPWAITNASYKKQKHNPAVTEIEEIPGRGHSLVIDSGWEQVAQIALDFVRQHHS